jgi:hypothetical protein
MDDTLDELKDANFYTHLDLAFCLWQVRVRDEDVHKTKFKTPYGLMEWVAMPFGLCNILATFYRMINDILRDFLHKFVIVYLDDACVCNRTLDERLEHFGLVLRHFKEKGLKLLRLEKCVFGLQEMEYLGYNVSAGKIISFDNESRGHCILASAYDAKGSSKFRAILQLICQIIHHFIDFTTAPLTDFLRKSQP